MKSKTIDQAVLLLKSEEKKKNDLHFSPTYFNTNEFIANYISFFDIKDRHVLTVTASGDQAFFSTIKGAKTIDTFDRNVLSRYVFNLKKAAIITLSREEYMSFIPLENDFKSTYFDVETYKKVREALDEDTRLFWDALYKNDLQKRYDSLRIKSPVANIKGHEYYSEENYPILQQGLSKTIITSYDADLLFLPSQITDKKDYYSTVFLSNIFDYSHMEEKEYLKLLKKSLYPSLTYDARVLAYYCFSKYSGYFEGCSETHSIYNDENEMQAKIRILTK